MFPVSNKITEVVIMPDNKTTEVVIMPEFNKMDADETAFFERLLRNLKMGTSLAEFAAMEDIAYCDLKEWIGVSHDRRDAVAKAIDIGREYLRTVVFDKVKRTALFDPRKAYDESDRLKSLHEMDDETISAVSGIEETVEGRKLKVLNLSDARKMIGQELGMFQNKVEHSGKLSLEELVSKSMEEDEIEGNTASTEDAEKTKPTEKTETTEEK
jgi:hypothetical protein